MRTTIQSLLLLLITLIVATPAFAGSSSTDMRVSATVIARTLLTVESQPQEVVVSAADVIKGFVELPGAMAIQIRSNDPSGYVLQFEPVSGPFVKASVSWGTDTVSVAKTQAWIAQAYHRVANRLVASVRIDLAPGTTPGRYAWPIAVVATSL